MYFINDIPLSDFGFTPGRQPNSNLAISGVWDMPSRIGKTHHDWLDENGVEPYLRGDEIFFGGRDISLLCWLSEEARVGYVSAMQEFYDFLDTLQSGLFTLSCPFGSWEVQLLDAQPARYLAQGLGNVELKFREPVVVISGELLAVQSGGVGIDGYSFSDLGLVKQLTKDQANRAESKQLTLPAYGSERIGWVKRGMREFSIDFFLSHNTIADFTQAVGNLAFLLSRPNARTLRLDDGTVREFFVKDGFKVSGVRVSQSRTTGFLTLNIAEIKMLENWNLLTDSSGLVLVDQYGQPLAEILKGF